VIYGYARVSTAAQCRDGNSLQEQIAALEKYGCQIIVQEAFSGKTMQRPCFTELLGKLQEGDTLVVYKLDRFARTAIDGVQTVRELFDRGVRVHVLNMGLIENTLTGNLILTVLLPLQNLNGHRSSNGLRRARQQPDKIQILKTADQRNIPLSKSVLHWNCWNRGKPIGRLRN